MTITYPLLTVVDDAGNVVTGATVAITSVTDKAGSAIASHGATVNLAGANVSVDYDAEAKGEAWVVLAVSKVGSTFTGLNAAPAFYMARDSGRLVANLDAAVSTRSVFAGGAVASVTSAVSINLSQTGLTPRALDAVADASLTVGDALVASVCGAAGKETKSGTAYTVMTPSTGTAIRTFTLDHATTPTARS